MDLEKVVSILVSTREISLEDLEKMNKISELDSSKFIAKLINEDINANEAKKIVEVTKSVYLGTKSKIEAAKKLTLNRVEDLLNWYAHKREKSFKYIDMALNKFSNVREARKLLFLGNYSFWLNGINRALKILDRM